MLILGLALLTSCGGGGGGSSSSSSAAPGSSLTNNLYPYIVAHQTGGSQLTFTNISGNDTLFVKHGDQITLTFSARHQGGDDADEISYEVEEFNQAKVTNTVLSFGTEIEYDKESGGWNPADPAFVSVGKSITINENDFDNGGGYSPIQYKFTVDKDGSITEDDETDNVKYVVLIRVPPVLAPPVINN